MSTKILLYITEAFNNLRAGSSCPQYDINTPTLNQASA